MVVKVPKDFLFEIQNVSHEMRLSLVHVVLLPRKSILEKSKFWFV